MKRTEALQALRERFEGGQYGSVGITQEEAAALGVFDDQDDGWIEWGGGECPLTDGIHHYVKLRDGAIIPHDYPERWNWDHYGASTDIIAYRIHRED